MQSLAQEPQPRAWQRMLSGRRLDLLNPSPLDIEVEDIAHGLARVARWNGQTVGEHAFSVAEHCLLVETIASALSPGLDRRHRLAALIHDAPEYVIGDLISPFNNDEPPTPRGARRTREAATLVGNVLAAGHDVDALPPVILESAVAVTGAVGARLVADGEVLARTGSMNGGGPPLSIALSGGATSGGLLVLYPPPSGFDEEDTQLAEWLAGRASIALQNAHLHRVTRQLASTDELTQLANRRQFDEALGAEVAAGRALPGPGCDRRGRPGQLQDGQRPLRP